MYVSEIMKFYCQPYMRSSSVIRQGALHALFHKGFWKSDHDFLIAFHSNFYLRCMVSAITRFYCKPNLTSSWFLPQGALHAILQNGFWKSDHDFLIAFHSNFLSVMHGFQDNEVYCQPDMTSSSVLRQGALHAHFHDGFWKSDHDFLIAFHSNFLPGMHGFWD